MGDVTDKATWKLHRLAGDIECKELLSQSGVEQQGDVGSKNNMEGWINEHAEMDREELMALDNADQPVHFLLTKIS
jgi:hypothetical protein